MQRPPASFEAKDGVTFLEPPELGTYLGLAIQIDRVLLDKKTPYQHLQMVEAGPLGRILLLNGSVQLSTLDEPAYHEMLVHVPLLTHPDPKRVLIIGGGDGGTLREVLRHPEVERAEMCEIDGEVIEACKQYMPQVAAAYDDPRAHLTVGDGIEYLKGRREEYDVILIDSSDPEGPALGLFGRQFYQDVRRALKPGGIAVSQAESFNFYAPMLKEMFTFLPQLFSRTLYYLALVPSYLGGTIGFAFCSLGPDPLAGPDRKRLAALGEMKYYTPALHTAAFALPAHYLRQMPPQVAKAHPGGEGQA